MIVDFEDVEAISRYREKEKGEEKKHWKMAGGAGLLFAIRLSMVGALDHEIRHPVGITLI